MSLNIIENRCTVEASFLDAEMKLLNQTISIVCNSPSELHQLGFHFEYRSMIGQLNREMKTLQSKILFQVCQWPKPSFKQQSKKMMLISMYY